MRGTFRLTHYCCAALVFASTAWAQEVRDPMRPAGATQVAARPRVASASALKLEGVINGTVRVAIVNGRLVRDGDEIAGARILEVLGNGVRYSRGGRVQSLLLPGVAALATTRVARSPEATKP
jgi:hypothetical protein